MIAEDQEIVLVGLRMMLQQASGIELVGEATNGIAAIEAIGTFKPDVVLMDIEMPQMDGIEATQQIKKSHPDVRVIMLTTFSRDQDIFGAFAAGADAYCLKQISPDQLLRAIQAVSEGTAWLDPAIADRVLRNTKLPSVPSKGSSKGDFGLSPRELDVLGLVVEGLSNNEIAGRLYLSSETIKTHLRHIMEKLAVSDRTQAAVKAVQQKLI